MIHTIVSPRFEYLLDRLCNNLDIYKTPSIFTKQTIIVSSLAIKRRLTLDIADRMGICTNIDFPFLAQWLWQQTGAEQTTPFSANILTWKILEQFDNASFINSLPTPNRLSTYLANANDTMRFDFALQIAKRFEEYITYRPEWLQSWIDGKYVEITPITSKNNEQIQQIQEDQIWQAALWQTIYSTELETSVFDLRIALNKILAHTTSTNNHSNKKHIHLFCEPFIAPIYLDALKQLSNYIDIHLYLFTPCTEYWQDTIDSKRYLQFKLQGIDPDQQHLDIGNPLLISWGKQEQAALNALQERFSDAPDIFEEPQNDIEYDSLSFNEKSTVLSRLQNTILRNDNDLTSVLQDTSSDHSLTIHSAHSLLREIEILHDLLLDRLSDPSVSSDQILIVATDLNTAAPMIESVFNNGNPDFRIPYTLTGQRESDSNPVANALLRILSLAVSRITSTDVSDILALPEINRKFDFPDDFETIDNWIEQTRICWALDGMHKQTFNVPANNRHSFDDGMSRLFLAYAMPDGCDTPIGGILPAGHIQGNQSALLGQFRFFIEKLRKLRQTLSIDKNAQAWRLCILETLSDFIDINQDLQPFDQIVRERIGKLFDDMQAMSGTLSFKIVSKALELALAESRAGSIPSGSVTIAPIESLRWIPFDHIYVLGMNDGTFPSNHHPQEFDLIQVSPKPTDRIYRNTEKNVFLDLLMSARKSLTITYTGKNQKDDSIIPPSILLSELFDALNTANIPSAAQYLTTEHPLQPFSIQYFKKSSSLKSYRGDYCDAIKNRLDILKKETLDTSTISNSPKNSSLFENHPSFFPNDYCLPEQDNKEQILSLVDLQIFFSNPCRYLLRNRLGINFPNYEEEHEIDEPLIPDGLSTIALADRILPSILKGLTDKELFTAASAGNEFPSGTFGHDCLKQEIKKLTIFASTFSANLVEPPIQPLSQTFHFDINGDIWSLTGNLSNIRKNGLIYYYYHNCSISRLLSAWIEHLFLNICAPMGISYTTQIYFKDSTNVFSPCENAFEQLKDLIAIYQEGLHYPIHFFPKTSYLYADICLNQAPENALKNAIANWERPNYWGGESTDEFIQLAMRGIPNPLDKNFEILANRIFHPMLTNMTQENTHE